MTFEVSTRARIVSSIAVARDIIPSVRPALSSAPAGASRPRAERVDGTEANPAPVENAAHDQLL
jgi:hypothetical protein